jgi:hypothetical protein
VKDSAEPVSSAYVELADPFWIGDRNRDGPQWSRLCQSLMSSVLVVELLVLAQGTPQVAFIPEQAAIKELVAAGLHPSLHDGVHAGHADAGEHGLDAGVGEDLLDEGGELPIPVSDQIARPAAGVLQIHHEILDMTIYAHSSLDDKRTALGKLGDALG